ncbi:MAG: hypothetical protein WAW17_20530, partial [Rhodococcus sp. (in: high G+C Gram-positive bacteria)]|uniref:hypothetical protein n=1 Tax=Rhodococcus sp. TaxID=1831 RepID=UPI003BB1A30C
MGLVVASALAAITLQHPRESSVSWLWTAGFVFMVSMISLRTIFVRSTRFDRQVNRAAILAGCAVALCEPSIARVVATVLPGGQPQILDLWHICFILSCFSMVTLMRGLVNPDWKERTSPTLYVLPPLIIVVLL